MPASRNANRSKRPRARTERSGSSARGDGAHEARRPSRREPPGAIAAPAKPIAVPRHEGPLPRMRAPVILVTEPDADHALIDSGAGLKLERYGPVTAVRPEAQAVWPPRLSESEWSRATATFTGATDTDDDSETKGRWAFGGDDPGEVWPMRHDGVDYWGRFTAFRHVGVFPEQAAHWRWMRRAIEVRNGEAPVRVLNLFGYTGVASLVAAQAGAEVVHVDASRKAIGWARENAELAGLAERPVRWICEDAMRFVAREGRRGNRYDIVLADPPKFGRGPNGEVWELFEHLPALLSGCRAILSDRAIGLVLTAYAVRASFYALHGLMGETMRGMGGTVESGELLLREEGPDARLLPTSLFSRWLGDGVGGAP